MRHYGYATCDAAIRKHVEPNSPAPSGFPYPTAAWESSVETRCVISLGWLVCLEVAGTGATARHATRKDRLSAYIIRTDAAFRP